MVILQAREAAGFQQVDGTSLVCMALDYDEEGWALVTANVALGDEVAVLRGEDEDLVSGIVTEMHPARMRLVVVT